MAVRQLFDQIRDYYIRRFLDVGDEYSADEAVTLAREPAFCRSNGELATNGQLDLPQRGDLLIIRDGKVTDSIQVDTAGMLSFEPVKFALPDIDMHVDLHPFQWNWMQLRIYGLQPNADWTPIRDWFIRWFQEHDPSENELLGGVHFLSDPEMSADFCQLSIDLGTAPVESINELLDAFHQLGVQHVQIGQFADGS